MRKFTVLLILMIAATMQAAAINFGKTIKANDQGVTYIGRTAIASDGSVSYDWTGVYLQTYFTGGTIAISASDAGTSFHNIFIDGKWMKKIKISGKEVQNITLASGLSKGPHLLRLQKCTEGEFGCTTIHAFLLAKGGTLKAVPHKERMIEIYGDSYTCGYGTESKSAEDPFELETENCDKAYGPIIARYFDADYALTAHSGQGMIRDWADTVQISKRNMTTRHAQVFDDHGTEAYDFKAYKPSIVLINLGTNDFSPTAIPTPEQYVGAYLKMIESIRSHYADVPILCVTPHSATSYLQSCLNMLKEQVKADKNVYMANPMTGIITHDHDMGASWHPNYQGQRKIAMSLIPQISAIMGWNMEDKTVK
jgi:lysophospholipase L1-like esterase